MIEINWNNFKAKFNDKEQTNFELLSYLLFLREFNQEKIGIFRYFNQIGIETEPIKVNGKWIGFQAKFYDAKLSDKKVEIKNSIKNAKKKNPELNKIYFYLHREFAPGKKRKEPEYQIEIEDFAESQNVIVVWRVRSHFQAQLFLNNNKTLAEYFFSLDNGAIDFIVELIDHTSDVLFPIHTEIKFNESEIKIDRSDILNSLKSNLENSPIIILSGEGGVGKTALVEEFYNSLEQSTPFFLFKATEFINLTHINQLFQNYGNFTSVDFINEFNDIQEKYLVIDSAEKLSDLKHPEVFQEFLSILIRNNWKVLFTTRHSYLDDLLFQFVEHYRQNFQLFDIEKIQLKELENLSSKYTFVLPENERFLELLRNPFYLNEYLQNYENINKDFSYSDFKNLLWNKQILKSSYRKNNRENCFLSIAKKRAETGNFFVNTDECDKSTLESLEDDEIIKYDSGADGFFITHDIYEEWALDKIIERTFRSSESDQDFFNSLKSSLPIRRAFRNWLSEKLLNNQDEIRTLIENSFISNEIQNFWKDEIIVSVLLSNYSEIFFQMFEKELLKDNQEVLMRTIFLLRIACKEIDENLLNSLGLDKKDKSNYQSIYTKPKGNGWNSIIEFIYKHKEEIGLSELDKIIPLLDEWNRKNKIGVTTKRASQTALYCYEEIIKDKFKYRFKEQKEKLIEIILNGSTEIKDELKNIFDEVLFKKEKDNSSKYHDLIQTALSSAFTSFEIAQVLPEKFIELANLFWFQSIEEKLEEEKERHEFGYSSPRMWEVEDCFCISSSHREYYPASAYQTPIYQLLKFSPYETLDFILSFTNKTVEFYAKSKLDGEVEEIEIFINDNETVKQYISHRLWNTFRGTQDAPDLLASIHMALERWLLDLAKFVPNETLENFCLKLLRNSKSASITAVVTSIVIAHPQKLFNVAAILFKTKELFFYDTRRKSLDRTHKSLGTFGFGLNNRNPLFEEERIEANNYEHRDASLESLALNYQFIKSEDDEEFEKRRKIIWNIWDKYKQQLPESDKSEDERIWRICLARMDLRKMTITVKPEKDSNRTLITFVPELEPESKEWSENSSQEYSEMMKYMPLKLWANFRFRNEKNKYDEYQQYETNLQLVVSETKEVIENLKSKPENEFSLYYSSTPVTCCAVLIKDFFSDLSDDEREYCKDVIMDFVSRSLYSEKYFNELNEGAKPVILSLPLISFHFPEIKDNIKSLLFIGLLKDYRSEIFKFLIPAIHKIWELNFDDAHSMFSGYLLLKPRFDELRSRLRKEHYKNFSFSDISEEDLFNRFIEENEKEIEKIIVGEISFENIKGIENSDLNVLNTAFELLPTNTTNEEHKKFVEIISPIFAEKLLGDNEKVEIELKQRFLKKYAYFVLNSSKNEIEIYLKPFIENFRSSEVLADLFQDFILAQDGLNKYEQFWIIWNLFYDKVIETTRESNSNRNAKEIVRNYLLAWQYWTERDKEWHTIKEKEKLFYRKVTEDIGEFPIVLYSLVKILNQVGSKFLEDGIVWISDILQKHPNLISEDLEKDTTYYLENLVRKYVLTQCTKIQTTFQTKKRILIILDFLVEKGSVIGYLLRESIL